MFYKVWSEKHKDNNYVYENKKLLISQQQMVSEQIF